MQKSSRKKVLITGGTGLLGTHLIRTTPADVDVYATVHTYHELVDLPHVKYVELDVTDEKQVESVIAKIRPDIVIHTAAHGRVDYCENNPKEAEATNIFSTQYLTNALNKIEGQIIFCSTNMIFDGHKAPYSESSTPTPQTVYGRSKVASEKYIKEHAQHYIIFRLMTMYGWNWQPERKNMISMAIEKLKDKQELWMTNDVYNNMLYVKDAAHTFWRAIEKAVDRQTIQIAGKDCINRFETTQQVCEVFGFDTELVHEVGSDYFKGQEVPRSPNTCFSTEKAESVLAFTPRPLLDGLNDMKRHVISEKRKVYETK